MRNLRLVILLFAFTAASFLISLSWGGVSLSLTEIWKALNHQGSPTNIAIIWQIRMPRILLGLLVGGGLAASGCVFQGMLRNPLADPYTLGISGGSAFGATIGVVITGAGIFSGMFWLPLCAFAGAVLAMVLVYVLATRIFFSTSSLILGGILLSFLFTSLVFLVFAVSRAEDVQRAVLWLMGDLSGARYPMIQSVALFLTVGLVFVFLLTPDLNILTLGEEKALHLGLPVSRLVKILFLLASLITGACVSAGGIIGFVGLMVPHLTRQITGPDHRRLIPASLLTGASFLILADTLARSIIAPLELPVGVITGILGSVFFLIFLLRKRQWEIF
jgi:iron complex transport system permease protein